MIRVGDKKREITTTSEKPKTGIVKYINVKHKYYTVEFISLSGKRYRECYPLPSKKYNN